MIFLLKLSQKPICCFLGKGEFIKSFEYGVEIQLRGSKRNPWRNEDFTEGTDQRECEKNANLFEFFKSFF